MTHNHDLGDEEEEAGVHDAGITFRMLMKRGGRDDRTRELHVPADNAMAAAVKARSDAEAAEREQVCLDGCGCVGVGGSVWVWMAMDVYDCV